MKHRLLPELTTQRIEAFSDGVFAIAITLLILEIKVPHIEDGKSLATELLHLWSSYFGFIFSFVMIGIYWANHHYIFHLYKKSDHYFVLLNIFFLMSISFLPFPTAVLAEYIDKAEQRQTAITLYAFGLFLPAFSWLLTWLYASRNHRLIDKNLAPQFVSHFTKQYLISNALYLLAILISLWNGIAGLLVCVCLTFLYLRAPKAPVFIDDTNEAKIDG